MTIPAPTTTTAAPIATFCHIFIEVGSFLLRRPACPHSQAITCRERPGNHGIFSLLATHTPFASEMFRQKAAEPAWTVMTSAHRVRVPTAKNTGLPVRL